MTTFLSSTIRAGAFPSPFLTRKKMTEKQKMDNILLGLRRLARKVVLFRNNVGQGYVGKVVGKTPSMVTLEQYYPIRYGLVNGSGDLVGWLEYEIQPEDVGKKIAVFTSVEHKQGRDRVSEAQATWMANLTQAGGIAIVVCNEVETNEILKAWKPTTPAR